MVGKAEVEDVFWLVETFIHKPAQRVRQDWAVFFLHCGSNVLSGDLHKYRGDVEKAPFKRLGRPAFFAEAVDMVIGRIKARVERKNLRATAKRESTSCAFSLPPSGGAEFTPQEIEEQGTVNGKSTGFAPRGGRIRELVELAACL